MVELYGFVVGGLYEYIHETEDYWVYRKENVFDEQVITYPKKEKYVVLDIEKFNDRLFSVKVLSSAGTIGRLFLDPTDWKRLDE
mgnify:CR=1 FL=1